MARRLPKLLIALALVLAGGAATARPAQLTAEEMRRFGAEALVRGYADQALEIAAALLARDPQDSAALVLRAQALRMLGRLPESEAAARAAWDQATTPGARYMAASAVAQALSLQGHRITAQYWLRQAVQNAPSAGARSQALQDLRYVRGETPVTLRFDLSVQPSDNVNGGSRATSFEFAGISFPLPARLTALSGLTWSLGAEADWRIAADQAGETALTFALQRSGVKFDSPVEGVDAADFDFLHLGAGIERKGRGGGKLALDLGRNWYGGEDLSATAAVSAELARPLAGGRAVASLGLMREARLDRASASSTQSSLGAGWTVQGPGGDQWRIGATWLQATSAEDQVARRQAGVDLDWQAAQDLAGLGLSAYLGIGGAEYGSGRREGRLSARLEAEVNRLSWLGFAPVLSLSWTRSNSNVLIYDSETLGVGLTIRSRF